MTQASSSDPLRFAYLLRTAHAMADASGEAIRPHFRTRLDVANKADGGFDPVTIADQAAERAIHAVHRRSVPDHGFVGEEFGEQGAGTTGTYRWVIDPIDGTRAFIMGLPVWGTLIGLLDGSTPVLGIMDQPFTGERFYTEETSSHWRGANGPPLTLKTRSCPSIGAALFATTHPDLFVGDHQARVLQALKAQTRMTRYGGDCYSYALLAAGHIDLVVETGLKPHDIVALIPLIERAGGTITTWSGASAVQGGNVVAAGDPALHAIVLKLIASAGGG